MTLNTPQPSPVHDDFDNPACWTAFLAEGGCEPWLVRLIEERDAMGRAKYGVPLRVWDGRDAVADAMQEALDLVVYLQRVMMRLSDAGMEVRARHMRNLALMLVRDLQTLDGRVPVRRE